MVSGLSWRLQQEIGPANEFTAADEKYWSRFSLSAPRQKSNRHNRWRSFLFFHTLSMAGIDRGSGQLFRNSSHGTIPFCLQRETMGSVLPSGMAQIVNHCSVSCFIMRNNGAAQSFICNINRLFRQRGYDRSQVRYGKIRGLFSV
jgi:hypothetical protein